MRIPLRPARYRVNYAFFRSYFWRKIKEGCECPPPSKDKIVEEKKCVPCSFANWKPKPRKVLECKLKQKKSTEPRRCYAGMSLKGDECKRPICNQEEFDPFKKKCCMKEKQTIKEESTVSKEPEFELPYADWDMNCREER